MRIFVSGGSKNGKSMWAQKMAKAQNVSGTPLYYVATMQPVDGEDKARIERHRAERAGWGFTTLEISRNITQLMEQCDPRGSILLDSVTALLMNEMYTSDGQEDAGAAERIAREMEHVLARFPSVVIVSDYIYSDAELYDMAVERYRQGLAKIDRACAAMCDGVVEFASGVPIWHKGKELYDSKIK